MLECELRDATSTRDVLEKVKPEWIFHLAAQSFVPTSWTAPTEALTTNMLAQLNIFEAVRHIGLKCRIQLACSSDPQLQGATDALDVVLVDRGGMGEQLGASCCDEREPVAEPVGGVGGVHQP